MRAHSASCELYTSQGYDCEAAGMLSAGTATDSGLAPHPILTLLALLHSSVARTWYVRLVTELPLLKESGPSRQFQICTHLYSCE